MQLTIVYDYANVRFHTKGKYVINPNLPRFSIFLYKARNVELIVRRHFYDKIQLCFTVFSLVDSNKTTECRSSKNGKIWRFYRCKNSYCTLLCYDTV